MKYNGIYADISMFVQKVTLAYNMFPFICKYY